MAGHTWTPQQRKRFARTMALRKKQNGEKKSPVVRHNSHFYRLQGTELIPVKVRRIVAWVIE